jgi:transcriptional regulator with XRE-family HTH domain
MPPESQESFGQTIRRLREAKGITLRKLAELLDVSPTFLSKIERDEPGSRPSEERIAVLAKLLDQDADEFLALAGRVSTELQQIILSQPKTYASFLRKAKDLPPQAVEEATRNLDDP